MGTAGRAGSPSQSRGRQAGARPCGRADAGAHGGDEERHGRLVGGRVVDPEEALLEPLQVVALVRVALCTMHEGGPELEELLEVLLRGGAKVVGSAGVEAVRPGCDLERLGMVSAAE